MGAQIFPISTDDVLPYGFIKKYQSYFPRHGIHGDPEQWSDIIAFGINLFELLLENPKDGWGQTQYHDSKN